LHSLKLTAKVPENRPVPKETIVFLPSISGGFREGKLSRFFPLDLWDFGRFLLMVSARESSQRMGRKPKGPSLKGIGYSKYESIVFLEKG